MSFKNISFKKSRDLILGILTLAVSGFYYYYATQIKTRPKLTPAYSSARIVPELLGILLALLSVILIIQGIKMLRAQDDGKEEKMMAKGDVAAVALTFAVIIGYTLLLDSGLGFCLSTMLYLFLQMLILAPKEKRNYLLFAIVAVAFTMFVFVAFRIGLQQLLPRGPIEALLGF